uniref:Uncharacterized protein n=1 Tax=Arundo donax TaxID=35708 RepID=A0A0A8ZDY5_ARUDO
MQIFREIPPFSILIADGSIKWQRSSACFHQRMSFCPSKCKLMTHTKVLTKNVSTIGST